MNKNTFFAALLFLCLPDGLLSQAVAGFGGISGVVRDASGAVVPSADVIVENSSKGIRRTLTSNDSGVFAAPALVPAPGYVVRVNKSGFQAFEMKDIEVLIGQNVNVNVPLAVAGAATQVEITDAAPLVEQTKTGISQVVTSRQIQELPINGRRVDAFVLLTPAVVSDGTFGLISFRGIAGGNSFLTDGNDTTNNFYNENAGRTRIATQISQDAVQEFQVLSNGYSAEYGRASGGVINTVTRSGGNNVHGTGYWFFRNQDFSAKDSFAAINPQERRDQFGGSIGGPIKKDKLFYFFNAESTRRSFPLIASISSPQLYNAAGQFIAACTATAAQCTAAQNHFSRQFQVLDRRADSELGFGKIDWRPTERDSFSFSFNYLRWISPNGIQTQAVLNNGNGVGNNANSTVRTRYGRISWTTIPSSTVVNEVRYGWFKDRLCDDVAESLIPAATGRIQLSVQGQNNLGVADAYPRLNPSENKHQIADNLTWTIGKHTWKFGGDFVNAKDYNDILRNRNGTYSYANFTNFALDFSGNTAGGKRWQSFSQRFGNPIAVTTIRDYSFYAQDQFRMTKNLTINYGIRYEYSNFSQPKVVNPDYPQTGHIPTYGKNWAPRIGLAYAMNNNKTVVRAGYGMFYARYPGGMINTFFLENGVYQKQISLNGAIATDVAAGPVFPAILAGIDRNPPAGTVDVTFAAPDMRNPYTQQGDLGIEHELTRNIGLTVSYLWSRGAQLFTVRDLNIGPLGAPVTYRINDTAGNQAGSYTTDTYRLANRVDTRWRRVNQVENGGRTYYDGLVVQMRKRFSAGWDGSVAYTWSHAIDFNQGGGNNNIFFSGGPNSMYNGNYANDKSSSALDQRHRFVGTAIFTPTFTKKTDWASKYLINNWQMSNIVTLGSSFAQTPTIFVSGNPFAGAALNTSLNGFGTSTRVPFLQANSLDIGLQRRWDARITKIIPITERFQTFLNFEAFNVLNTSIFSFVNGQAFSAANGVLTPTARLGEAMASQGFPDGTANRRAQVSVRLVF